MQAFAFDPEFAGEETSIGVQTRILNDASWIAANPGLISRAMRVSVLDAWHRTPESMIGIARRFGTATFYLHAHQVDSLTSHFKDAGFHTSLYLRFVSDKRAFDRSDMIVSENLPARHGLREVRLNADSSPATIVCTQRLMDLCGLPAMPGYFLRGLSQNNLSIALVDDVQNVVGCVIAMDDGKAGPEYRGWYFPGSVAVAPQLQGKKLGRWLNARAIQAVRQEGSATLVHEGVSPANQPSRAMILSCGLELDESSIILTAAGSPPPKALQ